MNIKIYVKDSIMMNTQLDSVLNHQVKPLELAVVEPKNGSRLVCPGEILSVEPTKVAK